MQQEVIHPDVSLIPFLIHFYGSIVLITAFVNMIPKNIPEEIIQRSAEKMWKKKNEKATFLHSSFHFPNIISFLIRSKMYVQ